MRAALAALLLAAAAAPAAADDGDAVPVRYLTLVEDGEHLLATGSFTDVFDRALLERLSSGFATTVLVRSYVFEKDGARPLAHAAATFRVVYDLWEEVYLVQVDDPRGRRTFRRATRAEALKDATTLRDFPVAPLSAVPVGPRFFVAMVVEVNPVSQELLAEVRRWLARPHGRGAGAGDQGNSFFGSFVSVFVNPKLKDAERELRFRSQPFFRVRR